MLTNHELYSEFSNRRIQVFHANSLLDTIVYAKHRGIVARSVLFAEGNANYTNFFTDPLDKQLGLEDKVFFNFCDQGIACKGMRGMPNAYGPILFVFAPEKLLEFGDFTLNKIPLTQAEKRHPFNPQPIVSASELPDMFQPSNPGWFTDESNHAELIVNQEIVPLTNLARIVVDPIPTERGFLIDHVKELFPKTVVMERDFKDPSHRALYVELCKHVISNRGNLAVSTASAGIREYLSRANRNGGLEIWAERIYLSNYVPAKSIAA